MGFTSLHVCMDSTDWLQGAITEEGGGGMDSSSSPSGGDMFTCSRPLMERRLRPQHDQALKCPRCDSAHTKFCYYNNYSLSQPRYFCKTCRRYWTKGGTLRNIPVGGGCRKNKKQSSSSKKSNSDIHQPMMNHHQQPLGSISSPISALSSSHHHNPTDLQLSFPADVQFSHLTSILGTSPGGLMASQLNLIDTKYNNNPITENPQPIDFMDGRYEGLVGGNRSHEFMGSGDHLGILGGMAEVGGTSFNGFCSSFVMTHEENSGLNLMEASCHNQRLMLPYEGSTSCEDQHQAGALMDVKPNPKLLSLEWCHHDQGGTCSDSGNKDSYAYNINGVGSWTGFMNGYGSVGPSTTNPLV